MAHRSDIAIALLIAVLFVCAAGVIGASRFGPTLGPLVSFIDGVAVGTSVAACYLLVRLLRSTRSLSRRYALATLLFVFGTAVIASIRFVVYLGTAPSWEAPSWLIDRYVRDEAVLKRLRRNAVELSEWAAAIDVLRSAPKFLAGSCANNICTYQAPAGTVVVTKHTWPGDRAGYNWAIKSSNGLTATFWRISVTYEQERVDTALKASLDTRRFAQVVQAEARKDGSQSQTWLLARLALQNSTAETTPVPVLPLSQFMLDSACRSISAGCERIGARAALPTLLELLLGFGKFVFLGYFFHQISGAKNREI